MFPERVEEKMKPLKEQMKKWDTLAEDFREGLRRAGNINFPGVGVIPVEKEVGLFIKVKVARIKQDIISAVESLKGKVTHTYGCQKLMEEGNKCKCDYQERINLIDEAFQGIQNNKEQYNASESAANKESKE